MTPASTVLVRFVLAALLLGTCACGDDDTDDGAGSGADGGGAADDSPCMRGCEATLEADCAMGPGSRAECESDCERLRSGECGTQYRALMSCAEGEEVTCSSTGLPAIEACDAEQSAFVACLN